jgi:glycogen debranching enzyme
VRTLAADEPAYDRLEYHDGTVWPHDNSLIAYGLASTGRPDEARLIVRPLLDCASFFEHRLPELFAGDERVPGRPPAVVPTSARPQAWAAGTPVLLLRALLGLEPDPDSRRLRVSEAPLPAWAEGLELLGLHAFGRRWNVRVDGGVAAVEPA